MIDLIVEILNMKIEEVVVNSLGTFTYIKNGSLEGLIKLVHSREVNITTCIWPASSLFNILDFTNVNLNFE